MMISISFIMCITINILSFANTMRCMFLRTFPSLIFGVGSTWGIAHRPSSIMQVVLIHSKPKKKYYSMHASNAYLLMQHRCKRKIGRKTDRIYTRKMQRCRIGIRANPLFQHAIRSHLLRTLLPKKHASRSRMVKHKPHT